MLTIHKASSIYPFALSAPLVLKTPSFARPYSEEARRAFADAAADVTGALLYLDDGAGEAGPTLAQVCP
jgi:hypothetical protein